MQRRPPPERTVNDMEQKKKFRFNVLDVVIILIVLACVAGIGIRYNLPDKIGMNTKQEAIITFSASNLRTDTIGETILDGDIFYCAKFNGKIGEIFNRDSFILTPAKQYHENEEGILTESTLDYRSDLVGYMKAQGKYDEDRGFLVDGVNLITPGAQLEIQSSHRLLWITVLSVELCD